MREDFLNTEDKVTLWLSNIYVVVSPKAANNDAVVLFHVRTLLCATTVALAARPLVDSAQTFVFCEAPRQSRSWGINAQGTAELASRACRVWQSGSSLPAPHAC